MKPPGFFDRYRSEINAELRADLNGNSLPLYGMMRYHLGWADTAGNPVNGTAGKVLRPSLCLWACDAVGGRRECALPAAAALELVHNYSLIHDDIQDNDEERRHMPTVWKVWGKAQAINAGTAMRMLASLALKRLDNAGVSAQKRLRAQELLDEATLELLEGQYLDISFEDRLDIRTEDYLRMISCKTAALISCSMEMGGLLGSGDRPAVAAFSEMGTDVGMAFQIRDDILGIWGSESETGKSGGSDLRRRKKSLPVVCALEHASPAARTRLCMIYEKKSLADADVAEALNILDGSGAMQKSQKIAEDYCFAARRGAKDIAMAEPIRRDMEDLFQFLLDRNH